MSSKFRCGKCKQSLIEETNSFTMANCQHSYCQECSNKLPNGVICGVNGCKEILQKENILDVTDKINSDFAHTVQSVTSNKCPQHKKPLNLICLDKMCPNKLVFHCLYCSKNIHSNCINDLKIDVEDFLKQMNLERKWIETSLDETIRLLEKRNFQASNWEQITIFVNSKKKELSELNENLAFINSEKFTADSKNGQIDVISVQLLRLESLIGELNTGLQQMRSTDELNNIFKRIDALGMEKPVRLLKVQQTHCFSVNETTKTGSINCCLCDENTSTGKLVRDLEEILIRNRNQPIVISLDDKNKLTSQSIQTILDQQNLLNNQKVDQVFEMFNNLKNRFDKLEADYQTLHGEKQNFEQRFSLEYQKCKDLEQKLQTQNVSTFNVMTDFQNRSIDLPSFRPEREKSRNRFETSTVISNNGNNNQYGSLFENFPRTNLLKESDIEFLATLFSHYRSVELLLNSRNHGGDNKTFHKLCDDKGPTLIVIKSGNFFAGGFTDQNWNGNDTFKASEKSFLFSIDKRKKYPIKKNQVQYAIYCHPNYGPLFGGGSDIYIDSNFKSSGNYSNLGKTYDSFGVNFPEKELFGSENFKVDAYEVYRMS